MSSSDGSQWKTQLTTNTFFNDKPNGYATPVAYGNGAYVALGYYWGAHPERFYFALRSVDGTNWTGPYPTVDQNPGYTWMFTFVSNIFLIGNINGSLCSSPDGIAWTSLNSGVQRALSAAAFGNGTFVVSGGSGGNNFITSTNGVDWTPRNSGYGTYKAMTYGPQGFVAWGYGTQFFYFGNVVSTSPDGINWSVRGIDGDINGPQIASIAFGGGTYVAVGDAGTIRQTPPIGARAQPFLRGSLGASGFALSAIAQPGYTYTIQRCGALGSAWTDFGAFTSTQAETIILDSTASSRSESFYRIRSP